MPPSKEKVPGTLRKISGKFQTEGNKTRGDANEFVPKMVFFEWWFPEWQENHIVVDRPKAPNFLGNLSEGF
jgi:hypothetical protein